MLFALLLYTLHRDHRRRMELNDKANVVASVWRAECGQFLAALAVLSRSIWKNRMNSPVFSKSTEAKQRARKEMEQFLSPKQTRRPLPCFLIPSFFYDRIFKQVIFPAVTRTQGPIKTREKNLDVLFFPACPATRHFPPKFLTFLIFFVLQLIDPIFCFIFKFFSLFFRHVSWLKNRR